MPSECRAPGISFLSAVTGHRLPSLGGPHTWGPSQALTLPQATCRCHPTPVSWAAECSTASSAHGSPASSPPPFPAHALSTPYPSTPLLGWFLVTQPATGPVGPTQTLSPRCVPPWAPSPHPRATCQSPTRTQAWPLGPASVRLSRVAPASSSGGSVFEDVQGKD